MIPKINSVWQNGTVTAYFNLFCSCSIKTYDPAHVCTIKKITIKIPNADRVNWKYLILESKYSVTVNKTIIIKNNNIVSFENRQITVTVDFETLKSELEVLHKFYENSGFI